MAHGLDAFLVQQRPYMLYVMTSGGQATVHICFWAGRPKLIGQTVAVKTTEKRTYSLRGEVVFNSCMHPPER